MTIFEQEIVEHLRKLDATQQEQVLAFIQSLEAPPTPNPEETWTDEEIAAMIKTMGTTGWEHIEDSVAWVEEQRRQHRK